MRRTCASAAASGTALREGLLLSTRTDAGGSPRAPGRWATSRTTKNRGTASSRRRQAAAAASVRARQAIPEKSARAKRPPLKSSSAVCFGCGRSRPFGCFQPPHRTGNYAERGGIFNPMLFFNKTAAAAVAGALLALSVTACGGKSAQSATQSAIVASPVDV